MSEDLRMSLCEIDLSWLSKTLLDIGSGREVSMQCVNNFKEKLKSSLDDA